MVIIENFEFSNFGSIPNIPEVIDKKNFLEYN
jgi:hypothetical protein